MRVNGQRIQKSTGAKEWERDKAVEHVRLYVAPMISASTVNELAGRVSRAMTGAHSLQIDQAWDAWVRLPKPSRLKPRALESALGAWRSFTRFLATRPSPPAFLHQITSSHCDAYLLHDPTLSGSALQRHHSILKRILRDLAPTAGIIDNPWRTIDAPARDTVSIESFSPDELRWIGAQATGFIRDLFLTGIYTGLRQRDIARLRWYPTLNPDDMVLDLTAGFIFGPTSKTHTHIEVPILPPLRAHLATLTPSPGHHVYPELHHLVFDDRRRETVKRRVRIFLRDLKRDDGTPANLQRTAAVPGRGRRTTRLGIHSTRHTFAFLAGVYGIPLPVVQRILGHMSERMTLLYTQHARRADLIAHTAHLPDFTSLPAQDPLALPAATPTDPAAALEHHLAQLTGPAAAKDAIRALLKGNV